MTKHNSEQLRAAALPGFVTTEWFQRQVTQVESIGIQRKAAAWLADHYDNWTGNETGDEFHDKLRLDMAVAGFFIDFLAGALRTAKKNNKKRHAGKPVYLMLRITAHARGKPALMASPSNVAVRDYMQKAKDNENWEDLRDIAFYCLPGGTEVPAQAVLEMIEGTPVHDELAAFVTSYAEKKRLRSGVSAKEGAQTNLQLWKDGIAAIKRIAKLKSSLEANEDLAKEMFECERKLRDAYRKFELNMGNREFMNAAGGFLERLGRLRKMGANLNEGEGEEGKAPGLNKLVGLESLLKERPAELAKSREAGSVEGELTELVELMSQEQMALEKLAGDASEDFAAMTEMLKAGRERQEKIGALAAALTDKLDKMAPEEEDPEKLKSKLNKLWDKLTEKWGDNEEWQVEAANNILDSLDEGEPDHRAAVKVQFLRLRMTRAANFAATMRREGELSAYRGCLEKMEERFLSGGGEAIARVADSPAGKLLAALHSQREAERPPADFSAKSLETEMQRLLDVMSEQAALKKRIVDLTREGKYFEAEPLAQDGQILNQQRDMLAERTLDVLLAKPVPPMPQRAAPAPAPAPATVAGQAAAAAEAAAAAAAAEGVAAEEGGAAFVKKHSIMVTKVNQTVDAYLARGEFEVAYLLQECGEAIFPDHDIANLKYSAEALECLAYPEKMTAGDFEAMPPGQEEGRAATFAVAAYPAVFQLSPSATALFSETGVFSQLCEKHSHIAAMRQLIEKIGNRAPSPDEFLQAEAPKDDDSRAALAEWYEHMTHKTSGFAAATYAWRGWMKADGVLGGVIVPMIDGGGKEAARELARKYRNNRGAVEALIDSEGTKIVGHYREHLQELFATAVEKVCDSLVATDAPEGDSLSGLCGQLRHLMQEFCHAPSVENAAAVACLKRGYAFFEPEMIHQLYRGEYETEPRGFSDYPQIPQDGHGMPVDYNGVVIRAAARALQG